MDARPVGHIPQLFSFFFFSDFVEDFTPREYKLVSLKHQKTYRCTISIKKIGSYDMITYCVDLYIILFLVLVIYLFLITLHASLGAQ